MSCHQLFFKSFCVIHRRFAENFLFATFLIIYGGFLLVHVWETGFDSWQLTAMFLIGTAVALAAHKGHGYLPSVFLVGHMLIEWYHHALHGNHYDGGEIAFHGVHAVLDMAFLYIEAREHCGRYAFPVLVTVAGVIAIVFLANYVPAQPSFAELFEGLHHNHGGGPLHNMVIGGMLGCVLSHLFLAPRWKHVH